MRSVRSFGCRYLPGGGLGVALVMLLAGVHVPSLRAQTETPVVISSSPTPVGSGARAAGVANAFVAVADDATAASWNPAGLVQLERPELSVVGSYYHRADSTGRVDRLTDDIPEIYLIGKDSTDSLDLNFLSAAFPFQLARRNVTLSLNYQRKFDFNRDFDFDYHQLREDWSIHRYFRIEQAGGLYALSPAFAVQVVPAFSLGLAFNVWGSEYFRQSAWTSRKLLVRTRTSPVPGELPARAEVLETQAFNNFSGYNGTFGLLWNLTPRVSFGAVVNLGFRAELRVDQRIEQLHLPVDDPQRIEVDDRQEVKMDFPLSFGLGLAFRPTDPLTFSLDYVRVQWQDFVFTDRAGRKYSAITSLPCGEDGKADVGATNTVRLGAEYLFIMPRVVWPVRAGFFYDPEPAEGGSDDYLGFTLGTGLTFKWFTLDLAYVFKTGSGIRPSNLTDVRNLQNARMEVMQHTLLFSLVARYD